jgi:hypothetical protein
MNFKFVLLPAALLASLLPVASIAQQPTPPPPPPKPLAHSYRLTYTVTVSDAGKRTGVQHFTMTISAPTNRMTLKMGEKIPLATGSYSADGKSTGAQTQFTYLDVGLNVDASLIEEANGVQLVSKLEQSSVAPVPVKILDVSEPVIRQLVLTNTSVVTPGKAVVIGSLDIPDTTRHSDIEVTVEQMP